MKEKPQVNNSEAQKQLDKAEKQFQAFEENVKSINLDSMNDAPKTHHEPLHKQSQEQVRNSKDVYLKPERSISSREKFNEDYRKQYEEKMEYVRFTAENREVIGETIELWTKPFAGMPAQQWKVPCGKPVWGPRHLFEQIKRCRHSKLVMQQQMTTGTDSMGQYYGAMAVEQVVQRLDAYPANNDFTVSMGKNF